MNKKRHLTASISNWLRPLTLTFMLALTAVFFSGDIAHATERKYTNIGTLGYQTSARAMNDDGVVVGNSYAQQSEYHAFVWQNGEMIDIGTSGERSSARGINNKGQVVGNRYTGVLEYHPFLWQNGEMTDLTPALGFASVSDINDNGKIVGTLVSDSRRVPYVYDTVTGELTELASFGNAHAINNHDQVVGMRAVDGEEMATLWQNGEVIDLGVLPNYTGSVATHINDSGNIVGWVTDPFRWEQRMFYWSNGVIQEVRPESPGWNVPNGINNHGELLGTHYHDRETPTPFISRGDEVETLTTSEIRAAYSVAINNAGQVVINSGGKAYISNATATPPEPVTVESIIAKIEQWQQEGKLPWVDAKIMTNFLKQIQKTSSATCLLLNMTIGHLNHMEQQGKISSSHAGELRADLNIILNARC